MRLLHIIPEMDPKRGGVCQAVQNIISGLTQLGVQSEVVSLDSPTADFLLNYTFIVHALGPGRGPWSYSSKLIPWLVDNLSRFDAVIVHGLWLYHVYASNKALRHFIKKNGQSTRPKFYIMPHGMLDPYFQQASSRRLKALRNRVYWKIIEGHVVNNADALLFTCDEECELAREPFSPYSPKKELIVGLGVEAPPPFTQSMRKAFLNYCPRLENQNYLLFLSRIDQKKGIDLLINAYADIIQRESERSAKYQVHRESSSTHAPDAKNSQLPLLVIAGPGLETAYGQKILELVQKNEALKKIVVFPGMLTGEAKWGAFYGCEAFVLPSHQENFGIAIVEALACGKPVLISNQVNIWREIAEVNGGIIADDTLEGAQIILKDWIKLPLFEKIKMSHQALYCYTKKFAMSAASEKLYDALCE